MAPFLALLPLLLPLISQFPSAMAQGTNATCNAGFEWMTNSRGQSPCLVSSYLFTPCSSPAESWVYPLPDGFHYNTPLADPQSATPCRCNTVLFSTIAACATCQGQGEWIVPWSTYSQNCSNVFVQRYPQNIPAGTAIPAWAYIDITANNTFDPVAAQALAAQNLPESSAVPRTSTTSSSGSSTDSSSDSSSTSGNSTPTSPPADGQTGVPPANNSNSSSSGSSSNTGAIAGGVVGGIVALIAIGLAVFFFLRHRRNKANASSVGPLNLNAHNVYNDQYGQYGQYNAPYTEKGPMVTPYEHSPDVTQPLVPNQGPRLYDPNDPTTFPSAEHGGAYAVSSTNGSTQYPATETFVSYQNPTYKGAPEL